MSKHRIFMLCLLFLVASASPGRAQILNTLRGFDEEAVGWSGRVAGAVDLSAGNTEYVEFTLGASAQFRTERQRWRLLGKASRKTSGGVETAESRLGHLRHNYRIHGHVSTVAFVQGQYDPFKDLETRILVGAGGQVDLLRRPGWDLTVGTTLMREDEKLTGSDRFHTLARLSSFLSFLRKPESGPSFDVSAFFQPALEDFGDARAVLNAAVEFEVSGSLFMNTSYVLEFDSDPPPGVKETDHGLKTGVGYRL